MRMSYLLVGLMACSAEKSVDDQTNMQNETAEEKNDQTLETGEEDDELSLPDDLNGASPEVELTVPTFTAMNSDDTTRNENDLQGMATVIWFFPLAGTAG